jgi:hypothetical protein
LIFAFLFLIFFMSPLPEIYPPVADNSNLVKKAPAAPERGINQSNLLVVFRILPDF